MFELLEDWKCNNEDMKSIAPTLFESVEAVNEATKDQIEEIANINKENEKRSDDLNNELIGVSAVINEQTEASQSGISKIIESVNNHTKHFAMSLKTSKSKIIEQFEVHKNTAVVNLKKIENNVADGIRSVLSSGVDIVSDIETEDAHCKEDYQKSLNFNTNFKTIVGRFNASSKEKLGNWRNVLNNFHKNELKMYTPSG